MARVPTRGCAWSSDSLVGSCLRLLKAFPLLVPPRSWNYHPKSSFPLGFAGGWGGNLDAFHATETLLPDLTWRSCPGCRINCRNRPSDPKWGGRWGPSLGLLPAGGGGGGRVRWVGGCQPHSSSLDEDAVQGVWRLLQEGTPSLLSSIPFLLPSNGVPPPTTRMPSPRGAGCGWGPAAAVTPRLKPHPKPPAERACGNHPPPSEVHMAGRGSDPTPPSPPKGLPPGFTPSGDPLRWWGPSPPPPAISHPLPWQKHPAMEGGDGGMEEGPRSLPWSLRSDGCSPPTPPPCSGGEAGWQPPPPFLPLAFAPSLE